MSLPTHLTRGALLLLFLLFISGAAFGQTTVPNEFSTGDIIEADAMNSNFTALATAVDTKQDQLEECVDGEVLKWSNNAWDCGTDSDSSGTVTGITAGTGISVTANATSPTVAVDTATIQRRVGSTCPTDQAIRVINSDGTVSCQGVTGESGVSGFNQLAGSGITANLSGGIASLSINASGVTTAMLDTGAVTSAKIGTDQVNGTHIVDGAISSAKIADDSINTGDIFDGGVGTADLADNAVTSAKINADAVTSAKIALDTIVAADIAAGAVGTSELAANAVTSAKIDTSTVQGRVTGTCGSGQWMYAVGAGGGVSCATLAAGTGISVTADTTDSTVAVASGGITSTHIALDTIQANDIAAGAVGAAELASNAVTNVKMADNSVDTAEIADGAVTTSKFAFEAVNSTVIDSTIQEAISVDCTATGSVIAIDQDGTVTCGASAVVGTGTVGTNQLTTDAVTSVKILMGAVTETKLADDAVTTAKISDAQITYAKLESTLNNDILTHGTNITALQASVAALDARVTALETLIGTPDGTLASPTVLDNDTIAATPYSTQAPAVLGSFYNISGGTMATPYMVFLQNPTGSVNLTVYNNSDFSTGLQCFGQNSSDASSHACTGFAEANGDLWAQVVGVGSPADYDLTVLQNCCQNQGSATNPSMGTSYQVNNMGTSYFYYFFDSGSFSSFDVTISDITTPGLSLRVDEDDFTGDWSQPNILCQDITASGTNDLSCLVLSTAYSDEIRITISAMATHGASFTITIDEN